MPTQLKAPPKRRPVSTTMRRFAVDSAVAILRGTGHLRRRFAAARSLRILGYHGVCADELIGDPRIPSYFVSASQFVRQLEIASDFGPIVSLPDVIDNLHGHDWPVQSCIAVTFDDVAACTAEHAVAALDAFGMRASFFISTGHVDAGRLFDADMLNLLRHADLPISPALRSLVQTPAAHKLLPIETLRLIIDEAFAACIARTDPAIVESLAPMSWSVIQQLAERGHDIGGHTVDHAILKCQSPDTRRRQITDCVKHLARRISRQPIGFAYPNGGPNDFDATDAATLKTCGVRYALSARAGWLRSGCDVYDLARVCIGRNHTDEAFALEVSGMLDVRRRRQQGWR